MVRAGEGAKARIGIVDDDRAVRDSLGTMLRTAGYEVATHGSAKDFLAALEKGAPPDCFVCDVRLPETSGLELLKMLAPRGIDIPVIMITGHGDVPMAVAAMKSGAADFIEKPFAPDEILRAVTGALDRHRPRVKGSPSPELVARFEALTPRERETLALIVEGHTNKSAAQALEISARTVEVYRARIMEKMGAQSLAELVHLTIELEL